VTDEQEMPPMPVGPADVAYSRTALARLALSAAAQELADLLTNGLVPTVSDNYGRPYDTAEVVHRVVRLAEQVRDRGVVYARERGGSWQDIAEGFGAEDEQKEIQERYEPVVAEWDDVLTVPWEPGHGISKDGAGALVWFSRLPNGAADPDFTAGYLDMWCARHVDRAVRDNAEHDGISDRMVSANLPAHTDITQLNRELRVSARLYQDRVPQTDPQFVAHRERKAAIAAAMERRMNTRPRKPRGGKSTER